MDDRELLELAAKASGEDVEWHDVGSCFYRKSCNWPAEKGFFNPLHDDGEALRLACVLGLTVECDFHDSDTCTAYQTRGDIVADEQAGMVGEVIGEPDFAATRRAIVRAAAEIGRAM